MFTKMNTRRELMTLQEHLASLDACQAARDWAVDKTASQAWQECDRADWMLWWSARTKKNTKQQIVLAACDCARLVLHLVTVGEYRPRLAIEAAEKWATNPNPTVENAAADAARAAAYAAARAAARAAADAAARAAADAAADAPRAAADAAADAARAAADAA